MARPPKKACNEVLDGTKREDFNKNISQLCQTLLLSKSRFKNSSVFGTLEVIYNILKSLAKGAGGRHVRVC